VTLNSGSIFVRSVNRDTNGQVEFFLASVPDQRYLIQASTDLINWVNLSTNIAIGSFMDLLDMDAPNYPRRFYRSALFDAVVGEFIGSFSRAAGGGPSFRISGLEGRAYILQASSDLKNWISVSTNAVVDGSVHFSDLEAAHLAQRFYRLKSQ